MGLKKFKSQSFEDSGDGALWLSAQQLQHGLHNTDAQVRRKHVWQAESCPQVTQMLLQHLPTECEEQVLEAIFVALARSADPMVVEPLLDLLSSEDVWLRNRALEMLAAYPQPVLEHVMQRFEHADADTRIFLVNLMTDLRHPQVLPWLLQVLEFEAHVNVVAAALEVLAEVGDASALPVLDEVLQRFAHEPFMVFAAQLAQQRIESS